jgi:carbonic anhydrase
VLASIEYAVEHLGCGLVVVLGHERCGAVSAAVAAAGKPAEHEAASHVPILVTTLSDAVSATNGKPGDAVENAVNENVRIVVRGISSESPYLAERIRSGALKVVGARYDLDTGTISIVE